MNDMRLIPGTVNVESSEADLGPLGLTKITFDHNSINQLNTEVECEIGGLKHV